MSGRGEDSGRAWPFPLLLSAERASSEPAGVHSTFAADASGRSGDAFSGWHAGSTGNLLPVLAELPFVSEPPLVKRFTLLLPGDIDWWNDDTVGESDSANNAEVASDDRLGWMNRVGNINLALHRQNPALTIPAYRYAVGLALDLLRPATLDPSQLRQAHPLVWLV